MRMRYVGFAEEATYRPVVPPAAVFHVDIASASLDVPSDPNLHFEGGLYRGLKTIRPGYYVPGGNIVYPADIRTIAYILKWALGNYKYTVGGAGINTHEIWSVEELVLPSFTARLGKDNFEHIFTGCIINSLELKVEGEYFYLTLDVVGGKDSKGALQAIGDLLLPAEYPLSFIDTSMVLGVTPYSCKFKTLTIKIANNLAPDAGKGFGTRFPCRLPVGARNVNISGGLFFEDSSQYESFWGDSAGISVNVPVEETLTLTLDSGAFGSMNLVLPRFYFSQLTTPVAGRTEITQGFSAIGLVDTVTMADDVTEVDTDILATVLNGADDLDEDIVS